jgi:large repetitive protein
MIGGFLAALVAPVTTAGAQTMESFALSSAAVPGQSTITWQGTSTTLTDPIGLTGQIDPTSGVISGATLSVPQWSNVQEGEDITYTLSEVNAGSATGTFDSATGAVTLNDSLQLNIEVLGYNCASSPIDVALSGTWDSATEDVTLATTSSFTIPQFPNASTEASCLPEISGGLNANPGGIAGSTGNALSIALNGQFAPGLPTTTALAANPASPQLAGTSVTLTATVTDPSGAGTPTGTVNFLDNGASIGTESLSSGVATLTTTSLPGAANQQLTAVYGGDTTYAGSTSSGVPYTVQPGPSISMNLPSSATVGAGNTPFTLTVSNPASGQSYANIYLEIDLLNVNFPSVSDGPVLSYVDSAGNVCPLSYYQYLGSADFYAYFPGAGAAPCGTMPSSMSLSAGSSITVNLEVSYPYANTGLAGSDQIFEAYAYTGSCASPTSCTAAAPYSSTSTAPAASGTMPIYTLSSTLYTPTMALTSSSYPRPGTTVAEGVSFDYDLKVSAPASPAGLPSPGGTLTWYALNTGVAQGSMTVRSVNSFYVSTVGVAPGTYTFVAIYNGQAGLYSPAQFTQTVTIVAPAPGVPYTCSNGTQANIVANANLPAYVAGGTSVALTNLDLTANFDGAYITSSDTRSETGTIGLTPTATISLPSTNYSGVSPTTGVNSLSWSGQSGSVPITGGPGTSVPVEIGALSFGTLTCTPSDPDNPITLGTVTIPGSTLTVSPVGSAAAGSPVTLTDTVSPPPTAGYGGQVDFYDGTTDLATVPVLGTVASFTTSSLSVGDHQLTAIWSGGGAVPPSTSNEVDLFVGNATVTTLTSSAASPSNGAQPVTFTATVTPPSGSTVMPTATVDFTENGNPVPSCTGVALNTSSPPTASCTLTLGPGASDQMVASYNGDTNYLGSTSSPITQATLPGSNVTVSSSANPGVRGQQIVYTATVTPTSGTTLPTGTVVFSVDGSTKACSAQPLSTSKQAAAFCKVTFGKGAAHRIQATYSGDSNYSGATSAVFTQQMLPPTTTTVSSSKATATAGKAVTFTARVRPASGRGATPTGYAGFVVDGKVKHSCALVHLNANGRARCTLNLAAGTHKVDAAYGGSNRYGPSTSKRIIEVIKKR